MKHDSIFTPCALFLGYNKWRQFCGLSQPQNLSDLAKVMNNLTLARSLLDLYGTPDNIDVWVGGSAEPFVPGGKVGPLFGCLIATQFQKIRQGDRYTITDIAKYKKTAVLTAHLFS